MIQTNTACWNPAFKTNTYFLPYKNRPYLFTIPKITPFTNMAMTIHTDRTVDMVRTVFYLEPVTSKSEQLTSQCSGKTICTAPALNRHNTGECKSKPSCGTMNVQPQISQPSPDLSAKSPKPSTKTEVFKLQSRSTVCKSLLKELQPETGTSQ